VKLDRKMRDLLDDVGKAMTQRRRSIEEEIRSEREAFSEAFTSGDCTERDPPDLLISVAKFQVEHLEKFAQKYVETFQELLQSKDIPASGKLFRDFWSREFQHFVSDRVAAAQKSMTGFAKRFTGAPWEDVAAMRFRADLLRRQNSWQHKIESLASDADLLHTIEITKKRQTPVRKPRGRPALRSNEFVLYAGTLYLNIKGVNRNVPFEDLLGIADELDAIGYSPREEECGLSEMVRRAISAFNSRQGNSKTARRLFTFVDLLHQGTIPLDTGPEISSEARGSKPSRVMKTINLVVKIRSLFRRCAKDVIVASVNSDMAKRAVLLDKCIKK
jgi:hypothetical protein